MSRLQTYERIVDMADARFRRFGFTKTPIADIARDLEMSSANIYKFFPSKKALIEAVGQKRLKELFAHIATVTAAKKTAFERIKDMILCVVEHYENIIEDEYDLLYIEMMNEVMKFTMKKRKGYWEFTSLMRTFLQGKMEILLADGVESGELHVDDPHETGEAFLDCLSYALEPSLLLSDHKELRRERLQRQFSLLLRAVQ